MLRHSNLLVPNMITLSSEKGPHLVLSREAEVYHVLRKLGALLFRFAWVLFLHGAEDIRHLLLMGWGGRSTAAINLIPRSRREIHKSEAEISNILWNEELRRALIIDFHRSILARRPISQRPRTAKRRLYQSETKVKRLCVSSDEKCALKY
ncbi:uncharacterized protein N7484_006074 [Penicillium longicatenatum]|uniref:uncharacterized protein n=1 Tax=Penicillium longicatenatum TaxID=1561947 RepID=UPI002548D762|nr:uncharacterized protein N7484_006074 [Penicillium longicatenatum]KAJ5643567.1 hypothetical protein N7484_006074 [Penicillium longicatenatum]